MAPLLVSPLFLIHVSLLTRCLIREHRAHGDDFMTCCVFFWVRYTALLSRGVHAVVVVGPLLTRGRGKMHDPYFESQTGYYVRLQHSTFLAYVAPHHDASSPPTKARRRSWHHFVGPHLRAPSCYILSRCSPYTPRRHNASCLIVSIAVPPFGDASLYTLYPCVALNNRRY